MTPQELSLAYAFDLLAGDPEWFPHPVRLFGAIVHNGEPRLRRFAGTPARDTFTGALLTAAVVATGWALGSPKHSGWRVLLAWTTLATRSLLDEAGAVIDALEADDIHLARHRLSRIVGRDTAHLNETEIARAVIETLAESACDGIVAPLFWLAVGGVPCAMAYKAINTLDSMIGHPEPPYRHFGRVAAHLDDTASFLPARLTALGIVAAAGRGWQIWLRDGDKHASPNAGQSEAAMAGALNVSLGGINSYDGVSHHSPILNQEGFQPSIGSARAAMSLVVIVSGMAFGVAMLVLHTRRKR